MNPKRPSRSGGPRGNASGGDDTPAQTNLGLLLQRALEAAQQSAQTTDPEVTDDAAEAIEDRETKVCANCWNAVTFKDEQGRHMARCAKDLWVRASFTLDDLNNNKIRRWFADCPAYDDSE